MNDPRTAEAALKRSPADSHAHSLSVVIAADRRNLPSVRVLDSLLRATTAHFSMVEIVIVANGIDAPALQALEQLIGELPDVTVHILNHEVERDAAVLFGVDNALGDWVLLLDAVEDQVREIPGILNSMGGKIDAILVAPEALPPVRSGLYDLGANFLVSICRSLTGIPFERSDARIRMLSRALCLRIVGDIHSEILLRWMPSETAFRVERRRGHYRPATGLPLGDGLLRSLGRGFGVVTRSSGVPLRALSLASSILAFLSLLYPLYIITVYLTKKNVAAGWTTLSLQLSALTFIVSLMFLMIAEYLVMIRGAMPPRRRVAVARELRSVKTARSGMLNVVDHEGRGIELREASRATERPTHPVAEASRPMAEEFGE